MDSAPSKRRKTSHTTSTPVDASTTPSPQRRPRRDAAKARTTPRRASFRSPTKASIARFNPELIARPRSASSSDRRDSRWSLPGTASPTRRPLSPPRSSVASVTSVSVAEASTAHESGPSSIAGSNNVRAALLQEETPTSSVEPAPPSRPETEAHTQGLLASPRRPPAASGDPGSAPRKSEERVVKPKAVAAAQEHAHRAPLSQRRKSAQVQGRPSLPAPVTDELPAADDGEPDLPIPPSPLGVSTGGANRAPMGLLSSPSRRTGRAKDSPAVPRSALAEVITSIPHRGTATESQTSSHSPARPDARMDDVVDESTRRPETRERLIAQLQELEKEVRGLEQMVAAAETAAAAASQKKAASVPRAPPDHSISSAASLSGFLPFAKPRRKAAKTSSSLPVPDDPPPSHHPIELENPLPYLRVFTPLTFTSTTRDVVLSPSSAPAPTDPGAPWTALAKYKEHIISATSPQKSLVAVLCLLVDGSAHDVAALQVLSLSPWAEAELGRWIRERADAPTPAGRDISSTCWAMGSYWLLAKRRAQFWTKCVQSFGTLVSTSSGLRPPPAKRTSFRRSLAPHLGRSSLAFRRGSVQLLLTWSISFDWTGEAESRVYVRTSLPDAWTRADSRASLSKVPRLFQTLLDDKGVFAATRIVVALVFPP